MNDFMIYIFAIIGIATIFYFLMKAILYMMWYLFFREKEERQMIHDLLTDCEDYKKKIENFEKEIEEMSKTRYAIIGINSNNKIKRYAIGTIREIEANEMLDQVKHNTIEDIIRDLDCFSDYKHFYKEAKKQEEQK